MLLPLQFCFIKLNRRSQSFLVCPRIKNIDLANMHTFLLTRIVSILSTIRFLFYPPQLSKTRLISLADTWYFFNNILCCWINLWYKSIQFKLFPQQTGDVVASLLTIKLYVFMSREISGLMQCINYTKYMAICWRIEVCLTWLL